MAAAPESAPVHQQVSGDGNIFTGTGDVYVVRHEAVPSPDRAALRTLREKVRQFWVHGVLENSLHGRALLALGKETMPDAVEHPWGRVLDLPNGTRRVVDPKTPALRLYEDASRMLLVLGEPGSGKTTTLLELARDLIAEAERDESKPVPVVLNLATWGQVETKMADWIASELAGKYGAPRKLAKGWLEHGGLVLLLDGLDEVAEGRRAACVGAINEYLTAIGVPGLCLCSRLQEYAELGARVRLNGAVRLEPLTDAQVSSWVEATGEKLAGFGEALRVDDALREAARSPLMLSIMSLAYEGAPVHEVAAPELMTAQARRAHAFRTYVAQMFRRRGQRVGAYGVKETVRCLHVLARGMRERSQTVFLIEGLQPDWLQPRAAVAAYAIASRAMSAFSLTLLFLGWLDSIILMAWGALAGTFVGVVDALRFSSRQTPSALQSPLLRVLNLGVYTLLGGASGMLLFKQDPHYASPLYGSFAGCLIGITFGLRNNANGLTRDIRPVEAIQWSRKGMLKGAGCGCLAWVLASCAFFLVAVCIIKLLPEKRMQTHWAVPFLSIAVVCAMLVIPGAAVGAMIGGLRGGTIVTKVRINEGIARSFKNALRVCVVVATMIALVLTLWNGYISPEDHLTIVAILSPSLRLATIAAMWYGGIDALQHYILRLLLAAKGLLPLRLPRFLDHCASLVFLQRVGGGYVFVHRLLLEHFAESPDDRGA